MMNSHVYLKHTVSGVVYEYDRETADRYLSIPQYAKVLVEVPRKKNEVLAQPHVVESGERVRLVEPAEDLAKPLPEAEKPRKKED